MHMDVSESNAPCNSELACGALAASLTFLAASVAAEQPEIRASVTAAAASLFTGLMKQKGSRYTPARHRSRRFLNRVALKAIRT